jgi:hypothetical protein
METIASYALATSIVALIVSIAAFWNAVKVRKNAENLERIQYAPRLAALVNLTAQPKGNLLPGILKLSNPSEKHLTLSNVSISGDAQADIGDAYRVLASNLIDKGAITIKSGESIDLPFKVVVGVGTLKTLSLDVYLEGNDAKGKRFRGVLSVGNCA